MQRKMEKDQPVKKKTPGLNKSTNCLNSSNTQTISDNFKRGIKSKFFNKADRNTKRKWKPIERALLRAKEFGLIDFKWNFREISNIEQKKENLSVNLFHEISNPIYDSDGRLEEIYYKYINSVQIKRNYALNNTTQVELPFALEKQEPKREQKAMKVQF
jgi:hypothetical protein